MKELGLKNKHVREIFCIFISQFKDSLFSTAIC
jgi:hypothetical protein